MVLRRIKTAIFLMFFAIYGCHSTKQTEEILAQAHEHAFVRKIQETQSFKLTTLYKLEDPSKPLVVYLEGDGHSMASKYRLSKNPTPHQPLALQLATLDQRPNVIYIARPCQYTPLHLDSWCHFKYWSTHRFSKEVVDATLEVMARFKAKNKTRQVHLIGFSGGGGLAALVAANDKDVQSVVTVAGDLNIKMMEEWHQITPQIGSLNPVDYASSIHVPQLHLSGGKDTVVLPQMAESFVKQAKGECITHHIEPSFSHQKGWAQAWPDLLTYLPCQEEHEIS